MIKIKTYPIEDAELKNRLERIGDLINFEGPLLSLFKDNKTDKIYLFDWIDDDELFNRWLIYNVDLDVMSRFIKKEISYNQMFDSVTVFYVTDIERGKIPPFDINKLEKIPPEYFPSDFTFFDEEDAKNLPKIKSVLEDLIGKEEQ